MTLRSLEEQPVEDPPGRWRQLAVVAAGILQRASLIALFALYLSYVYAGQVFMNFQWDLLLLETFGSLNELREAIFAARGW